VAHLAKDCKMYHAIVAAATLSWGTPHGDNWWHQGHLK
jgi:hypothetical protein